VNETNKVQTSSLVNSKTTKAGTGQMTMPTWGLIGTLIIALVVLKSFIYIKDKKRDGK
jgi:hypothetical protein